MARADNRFWDSTRGRILILLRRGRQSVTELAAALKVTGNAVRSHLTALERDGLIRRGGTRPGPRRPAVTYEISPEGDQLFPKAYGPILRDLLDVLAAELPARRLETVLRTVGHRLARNFRPVAASARPEERADRAVGVLQEQGGCCELQNGREKVVLQCFDCPLAVATEGHREICRLVETILSDVLAVAVHEQCRTNPPRCRFEFNGNGNGSR